MTNQEIENSIRSILSDPDKTPLNLAIGNTGESYKQQIESIIRSAIATYEPRAVITKISLESNQIQVRWTPAGDDKDKVSLPSYPDVSKLPPQEAVNQLILTTISRFCGELLGRTEEIEKQLTNEITRALDTDSRFELIGLNLNRDRTHLDIELSITSTQLFIKRLRYDRISQYDNTWQYSPPA